VYLAKSETLDMRAYQNTGTARALSTSTGFNFFSIAKVNIGGK
jgi:hypothetical protein